MRRYRFHTPDLSGSTVNVTGAEAKHAATVLRLKCGDEVALFDGQGSEVTGILQSIDSESMTIAVSRRTTKLPQSPLVMPSLILATAIPKGARADWMIEKCAELGVAELRPIQFERSVVEPGAGKLDRWRRLALAAAKQCGSAQAMTIAEPIKLDELLGTLGQSTCVYGFPETSETLTNELHAIGGGSAQFDSIIVVVGPEGGMSTDECTKLSNAGAMPVSWAQTTLRVETAAVAAAAVFASYSAGYARQDV